MQEDAVKALNVFLSRVKKVCFIPFILFSFMIGMIVHESYHWIDYKIHGMTPREICFFGYYPDVNAVGWVRYKDESKMAFKSSEVIANILTLTISVVTIILVG